MPMRTPDPAQTYLVEAADLLDQVEEIILDVEKHPDDHEAVNRLFRAFHTIKGSGAMFGFEAVAAFTHHVESTLDQLRHGMIAISPSLVGLILAARDHIQHLLSDADGNVAAGRATSERLAAELRALCGAAAPAGEPKPTPMPPPAGNGGAVVTYRIHFKPNPNMSASGLDPASVLDELRGLGKCEIVADTSGVPVLDALDGTKCQLAWDVALTTDRGLNAVKDVFIFAEDGSDLRIEMLTAGEAGTAIPPGAVAQPVSAPENAPPEPAPSAVPPVPTIGAKSPAAPMPAPETGGGTAKSIREGVVRVPSNKLDHIVNLVGELVMNESRLSQVSQRLASGELAAPVEAIERLIAELRDSVLGIRMMPIGSTFSRFKRLVHDLSRDLGKDVELVTEGADTELDKTVLDQLADPLVHLIRNSIGHGIEAPAERAAAGKPPHGIVRLAASHEGSHVVVTIEDDGRGLDAGAIRAKAVEKQLIGADANLSETEIFNLIFLPDFSTATHITAVSGRGVGMDVVRKQIDALRGGIQLSSVRGKGTTISLALPLTLAIIEGLLVTIAGDPFIIPMSVVMENVELHRAERARNNGRNLITVRGELIPYLHLRELFGVGGEEPEIEKIVIVRFGRDRVGLVVDRVLGSHQTVIQSLGRMFKGIGVISGGTILGDGRVALIFDLAGLVACGEKQREAESVRSPLASENAA